LKNQDWIWIAKHDSQLISAVFVIVNCFVAGRNVFYSPVFNAQSHIFAVMIASS